jgi:hypothetical protein
MFLSTRVDPEDLIRMNGANPRLSLQAATAIRVQLEILQEEFQEKTKGRSLRPPGPGPDLDS